MKKFKTFLFWALGLFTFVWRLVRRHAVKKVSEEVETIIKEEERDKYDRENENKSH